MSFPDKSWPTWPASRWATSIDWSVPLEGLAAAIKEGALSFDYLDVSAFDWFARASSKTFEELSEETGIPFGLLTVVRESFGYGEPEPADYVREDELAVSGLVEGLLNEGYRIPVIESLLRVYADNLRRIADAETHLYRTEIELRLLNSGVPEREMLDAQAEIGSRVVPLLEPALVAMYHAQQERTWTRSAVEDIENVLEQRGPTAASVMFRRSASST